MSFCREFFCLFHNILFLGAIFEHVFGFILEREFWIWSELSIVNICRGCNCRSTSAKSVGKPNREKNTPREINKEFNEKQIKTVNFLFAFSRKFRWLIGRFLKKFHGSNMESPHKIASHFRTSLLGETLWIGGSSLWRPQLQSEHQPGNRTRSVPGFLCSYFGIFS